LTAADAALVSSKANEFVNALTAFVNTTVASVSE
jgi:hypothetical protein